MLKVFSMCCGLICVGYSCVCIRICGLGPSRFSYQALNQSADFSAVGIGSVFFLDVFLATRATAMEPYCGYDMILRYSAASRASKN